MTAYLTAVHRVAALHPSPLEKQHMRMVPALANQMREVLLRHIPHPECSRLTPGRLQKGR